MHYAVLQDYQPHQPSDRPCGRIFSLHLDKLHANNKMVGLFTTQRALPDQPTSIALVQLLRSREKGDRVFPSEIQVLSTLRREAGEK